MFVCLAEPARAQGRRIDGRPETRLSQSEKPHPFAARQAEWTSPKALANSNDTLKWAPPKAAPAPHLSGHHPRFLQPVGHRPNSTPVPHLETAASVSKASHTDRWAGSERVPLIEVRTQPARLPRQVSAQARPLFSFEQLSPMPPEQGFRLVAAQQDGGDLSSGVFDDVLDDLLPGDEPPGEVPPTNAPALPDRPTPDRSVFPDEIAPRARDSQLPGTPVPGLPDDFGSTLPDAAPPEFPDGPADDVGDVFGQDELDDVFGDEPGVEVVPPREEPKPESTIVPQAEVEPRAEFDSPEPAPAESSELEPETGFEMDAELELPPVAPEVNLLPESVPDPQPLPHQRNPLRHERRIPEPSIERAVPLLQLGDDLVNYNGRDCPEETADLQDAWNRLRRTPIQSISLDITPSVEPNDSIDFDEPRPQEVIEDAPSRTWYDRRGKKLAEGKFEDYRQATVFVRTAEGETKPLSWYDLSNADLCFVSAWWGIPSEFSPEGRPYEVRDWTMTTFTWTASALCHKPLYFEEVQLERYGHTAGPMRQATLSGVHFFGNIFFLPYKMGLTPPNECKYALGYYRPGDCAPWTLPAIPLSSRAMRWQIGAVAWGLSLVP